jgi:hypothetical protein
MRTNQKLQLEPWVKKKKTNIQGGRRDYGTDEREIAKKIETQGEMFS